MEGPRFLKGKSCCKSVANGNALPPIPRCFCLIGSLYLLKTDDTCFVASVVITPRPPEDPLRLRSALAELAAPWLAAPLTAPTLRIHVHNGMTPSFHRAGTAEEDADRDRRTFGSPRCTFVRYHLWRRRRFWAIGADSRRSARVVLHRRCAGAIRRGRRGRRGGRSAGLCRGPQAQTPKNQDQNDDQAA